MNRYIIILFSLLLSCTAFSRPRDRHVVVDTISCTSPAKFKQVIDKFFYQFQTGSDSLFNWVYLNTDGDGNSNEGGKDAIALVYTTATYDSINKTGDQAMDIYVFGSKMFPDRHLLSVNHGLKMTATYTGSLLEDASIVFRIDSVSPHLIQVHYEFNLLFGYLASMFISDKVWKGAIKWRLEQILANLIEYAETGTVKKKK